MQPGITLRVFGRL